MGGVWVEGQAYRRMLGCERWWVSLAGGGGVGVTQRNAHTQHTCHIHRQITVHTHTHTHSHTHSTAEHSHTDDPDGTRSTQQHSTQLQGLQQSHTHAHTTHSCTQHTDTELYSTWRACGAGDSPNICNFSFFHFRWDLRITILRCCYTALQFFFSVWRPRRGGT